MTVYRFPRTEREAFQNHNNPVLTRRRSTFSGPFRVSWRERIRNFFRGVFFYG